MTTRDPDADDPDVRRRVPIRTRLLGLVRIFEEKAATSDRRRLRLPLYLWRLALQVVRQWARDRCPQQAASLSFQTLLSIVPAMAVAMAALRATGSLNEESSLIGFLSDRLLPFSRDEITIKLREWSENVTFESLGLVGLLTTVTLAFVMFNSLERVLNQIWRVERRRSLTQKFVVFYATGTIGPFLIGVSVYQAGKVGLTTGIFGFLFGFMATFGALFLANYFLPATKVRVVPAAVAATITAVLFETAKNAFAIYVASFGTAKYSGIYGAVAVVPLALVWIYWSWLMLLLGAEVAHALQNLQWLQRVDRRGTLSLENELLQRVNGTVAARVMVAISESFTHGAKGISRKKLENRFDVSQDVLERIAVRLIDADLVLETDLGLVPARPPSEITLAQVLTVFRGVDTQQASRRDTEPVDRLLSELDETTRLRTEGVTLDQLVQRGNQHVKGSRTT